MMVAGRATDGTRTPCRCRLPILRATSLLFTGALSTSSDFAERPTSPPEMHARACICYKVEDARKGGRDAIRNLLSQRSDAEPGHGVHAERGGADPGDRPDRPASG